MTDRPEADSPEAPAAAERPRIGVDEWVAQSESRTAVPRGALATLRSRFEALPLAARIALLVVPLALLPLLTSSEYHLQVLIDTVLFMLLALGLNVVVGFSGLLDLGYVAFFGFGAYAYTMLASAHTDLHFDAWLAIPIVVAASALLGFLVGLPSRRLVGDYLAIVTLFFLQIFVTVLLNADRLSFPFVGTVDFTRGPNGISSVDPLSFFGLELRSLDAYFYFALVTFVLVIAGLYALNNSRTGRAWRALREDPLAAEAMSIPVNRLKLMAFAFGAGTAGLTGSIFAASQGAVFPVNFDLTLLITVYAMVILGGAGSLAGVALGAIVINIALEALRTPEDASWLFFGGVVLALLLLLRPWPRVALVFGGVIAFGFAARGLAELLWPRGTEGTTPGGSFLDRLVDSWVLLPENPVEIGRYAFIVLVAAVLGLTLLHGWTRLVALIPVLYLAACVWENVLVAQPSVARYILLGAMLVGLMAARPQGLLGTPRVEIV